MQSEEHIELNKGEVEAESIAIKEEFITVTAKEIKKECPESTKIKQDFTANALNNYIIYEIQELQNLDNDVKVEENYSPNLNVDSERSKTKNKKNSFGKNYKMEDNHFICLKCSKSKKFKNRAAIHRHIRREHFGIKFRCPECENIYLERHSLKHHLANQHNINIKKLISSHITIVGLESSCRSDRSLDVTAECHAKRDSIGEESHIANGSCGRAQKEIKLDMQEESYDTVHIERSTGALQCEPNVINEAEIERSPMENHQLDTDLKSELLFESTECQIQGQTSREELYNMENIFSDKRFFSYKQYYKVQGDSITCLKCTSSKKFNCLSSVTRHIRREHFGVKFMCPECKNKFMEKYQLKKHLKDSHNLNIKAFEDHHLIVSNAGDKQSVIDVMSNDKEKEEEEERHCNIDHNSFSYKQYFEVKGNNIFCLKCTKSKQYKCRTSVIRHIRIEHLGRKYICPECKNKYLDKHSLKKHSDVHHKSNIDRLESSFLKKNTTMLDVDIVDNTEYKTDKTKANIKEPITSNYGKIVFSKMFKMSLEQSYRQQGKHFICLKCTNSMKFKYRTAIICHVRSKHFGLRYFCPECEKEFPEKRPLKYHLQRYHKLNINTLKNNSFLKYSETTESTLDIDNYKQYYKNLGDHIICLKCKNSKKYNVRSSVIRHIRWEHFGLIYLCPKCNSQFLEKRSLKDHLKKHHEINIDELKDESYLKNTHNLVSVETPIENDKERCFKQLGDHIICLKCKNSRKFNCRSSVDRHFRKEHLGVRFLCPKCKREYTEKWHLTTHLKKIHKLNINEVADTRIFKTATDMHDQRKTDDINTDDKQKCIKSTKLQSSLKTKQLILYNKLIKQKTPSNFICLKCKNRPSFMRKITALRHIRTKHMLLKYICPKCQREYKNQRDFSLHMRLQHQLIYKTHQNFIKTSKKLPKKLSIPRNTSSDTLQQSFEFLSGETIGNYSDKAIIDGDDDDAGENMIMDIVIKDEKLL